MCIYLLLTHFDDCRLTEGGGRLPALCAACLRDGCGSPSESMLSAPSSSSKSSAMTDIDEAFTS